MFIDLRRQQQQNLQIKRAHRICLDRQILLIMISSIVWFFSYTNSLKSLLYTDNLCSTIDMDTGTILFQLNNFAVLVASINYAVSFIEKRFPLFFKKIFFILGFFLYPLFFKSIISSKISSCRC